MGFWLASQGRTKAKVLGTTNRHFWAIFELLDDISRNQAIHDKKFQNSRMPTTTLEVRAKFQSNRTKNDFSRRAQSFHVLKMSCPVIYILLKQWLQKPFV